MPRSTEEIISEIKQEQLRQKQQLIDEGKNVYDWEVLKSKHNIPAMAANNLAKCVHEKANTLRSKGIKGMKIPQTILQDITFAKFAEDFPFLFKLSLSPNPKVLEVVHFLSITQQRFDEGVITEQEKLNIQQRFIIDYAPILAGNTGDSSQPTTHFGRAPAYKSTGPTIEEVD